MFYVKNKIQISIRPNTMLLQNLNVKLFFKWFLFLTCLLVLYSCKSPEQKPSDYFTVNIDGKDFTLTIEGTEGENICPSLDFVDVNGEEHIIFDGIDYGTGDRVRTSGRHILITRGDFNYLDGKRVSPRSESYDMHNGNYAYSPTEEDELFFNGEYLGSGRIPVIYGKNIFYLSGTYIDDAENDGFEHVINGEKIENNIWIEDISYKNIVYTDTGNVRTSSVYLNGTRIGSGFSGKFFGRDRDRLAYKYVKDKDNIFYGGVNLVVNGKDIGPVEYPFLFSESGSKDVLKAGIRAGCSCNDLVILKTHKIDKTKYQYEYSCYKDSGENMKILTVDREKGKAGEKLEFFPSILTKTK